MGIYQYHVEVSPGYNNPLVPKYVCDSGKAV